MAGNSEYPEPPAEDPEVNPHPREASGENAEPPAEIPEVNPEAEPPGEENGGNPNAPAEAAVENINDIATEFITPLQQEQRNAPPPNPQASAKSLAANEEVADKLKNQDKQVDITLKMVYGFVVLIILFIWLCFVMCFSNKQLEPDVQKIRHVSDAVFITLLTTTTANIIALPTIILKYLFAHHDKQ